MIPPVIKIRKKLSSEQKKTLIKKLESSELFNTPPCKIGPISIGLRVNVKNIQKEHPKSFFGYLPIGFIGINSVELVNLDKKFPEDYYFMLAKICYSID
jgi:hypothetical protein